jgi:hypothetical protein
MREGTSLNILTRESHVETILDQSRKGESFSCSPINSLSFNESLLTGLENLSNESVELLFWVELGNLEADLPEFFNGNS